MFVPAVIKLSSLERFLFSSSAPTNGWAKSLYLLGATMEEELGVEVAGVAPDFEDWYVCFYSSFEAEDRVLGLIRASLVRIGARSQDCKVIQKAREFGKRSGHRRIILRIRPSRAVALAWAIRSSTDLPVSHPERVSRRVIA